MLRVQQEVLVVELPELPELPVHQVLRVLSVLPVAGEAEQGPKVRPDLKVFKAPVG